MRRGRTIFQALPLPLWAGFMLWICGCGGKSPVPPVPDPSPESATLPRSARPSDWFEDVTHRTGIDFEYRNGREGKQFTILETVGGGAAILDYDRDGWMDVFLPGGGAIDPETAVPSGKPGRLYRNRGGWAFEDVTEAAGLLSTENYTHGTTAGDFDNDGWADLLITGYGRTRLYQNQGDGSFRQITETAGLPENTWHTASAMADLDRDGLTDLLLISYVDWKPELPQGCPGGPDEVIDTCPPQNYAPLPDQFLRNSGDGHFEDRTRQVGLKPDGKGLGVLAADFNRDGRLDVYVANDQVANFLYWGQPDGTLKEDGYLAGVSGNEYGVPEGSMGVDLADANGDDRPDLFVTNFEMEDNSLYLAEGNNLFAHQTVLFGLGGKGRTLVGFGTAMEDFNGDARPDLVVINGHVLYSTGMSPFLQTAALFRNDNGERFTEVTKDAGVWFDLPHAGRGLAVGDLDNDGSLDLAVSSLNEPMALLKNNITPKNWVRLELVGRRVERQAVGAVVTVEWNDRRITRFVKSGAGYLSSFDPRLLIALPDAEEDIPVRVRVNWDGTREEVYEKLAPNRMHVLVEGRIEE